MIISITVILFSNNLLQYNVIVLVQYIAQIQYSIQYIIHTDILITNYQYLCTVSVNKCISPHL